MKLVLANHQGHIEIHPGEMGYTLELSLHFPGESEPYSVDLRPEEWAALTGAAEKFQEEFWRGRER